MKKLIKYLLVAIISFPIGVVIGLLWHRVSWLNLDNAKQVSAWEISYYIFSIFGSVGTIAAVVVALAKESIMRMLHHPELELAFVEEYGLSEDIDTEQQNPETENYICEINVTNRGSVVAKSCEVIIERVGYADKKGRTLKYLKDYQSQTSKLEWGASSVEIPVGISKEIRLFTVASPGSTGTPGSTPTSCHLDLSGFK